MTASERPSPSEARDCEEIASRPEFQVLRHRLRTALTVLGLVRVPDTVNRPLVTVAVCEKLPASASVQALPAIVSCSNRVKRASDSVPLP